MELRGIQPSSIRFAFSSARETLRALAALALPTRHPEHVAWVRRARPLARELKREIRHFHFLLAPIPEVFIPIWPSDSRTRLEEDLAMLRASLREYTDSILIRLSGERIVDDRRLRSLRRKSWLKAEARRRAAQDPTSAPMLTEFVASPRVSLERFATLLEAFSLRVMQPLLGPIADRLRQDVDMRREILDRHGLPALLRTLSSKITVVRQNDRDCAIRFGDFERVSSLPREAELTLTPSYFVDSGIHTYFLKRRDQGLRATIVYPLPAIFSGARRIANPAPLVRILNALAEPSRLRVVELLAHRDMSTRELAGFLRVSEPTISRHLRILYDAGAVDRNRHSYFVVYTLRREALRDLSDALLALST